MAKTENPPKESSGKSADKKPRQPEASPPVGEQIATYFKGVRSEWTKITWPTWPQIWGQTIVVLVMVSIMTLGLFIMDNSFSVIITTLNNFILHRS